MRKIGVFGAAFNPPTLGHADVIAQASSVFDEIILVPSAAHAFGKTLLPFAQRCELLEAFLSQLPANSAPCTLSHIEQRLYQAVPEQPVYTFDMLNALEQEQQGELHFILGPDNAAPDVWQTFYRYADIEQRWPLFIAQLRRNIRSTHVRSLLQQPRSQQQRAALTHAVGPILAETLLKKDCYTTSPSL